MTLELTVGASRVVNSKKGGKIEGNVVVVDSQQSGVAVLASGTSVSIVNLKHVASVEQGPQGTDKPEPIGQIDVKWLHKFEHEQAKLFNDFNASVPAEAQELYNELKKILPVEWKGQKIVLFGGDATIEPPYTQLQGDTSIMSLATKVLEKVNQKYGKSASS